MPPGRGGRAGRPDRHEFLVPSRHDAHDAFGVRFMLGSPQPPVGDYSTMPLRTDQVRRALPPSTCFRPRMVRTPRASLPVYICAVVTGKAVLWMGRCCLVVGRLRQCWLITHRRDAQLLRLPPRRLIHRAKREARLRFHHPRYSVGHRGAHQALSGGGRRRLTSCRASGRWI